MARLVTAVYRCRHCGAVYRGGEFERDCLAVSMMPTGLSGGERVLPAVGMAAMWDIHTCDACLPRFGIGDLIGWEI